MKINFNSQLAIRSQQLVSKLLVNNNVRVANNQPARIKFSSFSSWCGNHCFSHLFSLKEVEEPIHHFHLLYFFSSHDTRIPGRGKCLCGAEDTEGNRTHQGHDKEGLHLVRIGLDSRVIDSLLEFELNSLVAQFLYTFLFMHCYQHEKTLSYMQGRMFSLCRQTVLRQLAIY